MEDATDKSLFFFDADTGNQPGTFVHPRPQTSTENCTWHYYNVVPTDKGRILVSGNDQSGISVVDFTDPTNAKEIAYADPAPIDQPFEQRSGIQIAHAEPGAIVIGGDWSAY